MTHEPSLTSQIALMYTGLQSTRTIQAGRDAEVEG